MSPPARSGQPRDAGRGAISQAAFLLSSGAWLIVSLLRGRRRARRQSQQLTPASHTATDPSSAERWPQPSIDASSHSSSGASHQSFGAHQSAGASYPSSDDFHPPPGASATAAGDVRAGWLGDPLRCATADGLLLLLGAATVAACLLDAHGNARLLLVLASACLIPGGALLTRLPVEDLIEAFGLAVGLGFAIEAIGALAMAWTGWWHPLAWAIALVTVACGMLALDVRRSVALIRASR
jgi:hypothetical protein